MGRCPVLLARAALLGAARPPRGPHPGECLWMGGGEYPGPVGAAPPALPGNGDRMTDHLYRLAAHALDRLPAAAPRIGSRFEPVAEVLPAPDNLATLVDEPV